MVDRYGGMVAWWQSTSQIFLNLVMLARPEDMPTNCLNRIVTTVLATGFLPKELLVCGIPCQQVQTSVPLVVLNAASLMLIL